MTPSGKLTSPDILSPRELAVIIPAFKPRYFETTLASIEAQTSTAFHAYIFDDGGPKAIKACAEAVIRKQRGHWSYTRFENNLGSKALTEHYDRCIKATREPWIWLFSDDDMMDDSCVASTLDAIRRTESHTDVLCLDSVAIDSHGRITALHPTLPERESWRDFAYFFLNGHRSVPQQSMVFSRSAYQRMGGFLRFPAGWTADQAMLMAMAQSTGIRRISNARVHFRQSGHNISSIESTSMAAQKLQATMMFLQWLYQQLKEKPTRGAEPSDKLIHDSARTWLKCHIRSLHIWLGPTEALQIIRFCRQTFGERTAPTAFRVLKNNLLMTCYYTRRLLTRAGAESRSIMLPDR